MQVTWKEQMAVYLSRIVEDGDRICSGAHTEISFAATMLAQKTHAPNSRLQLGGTCFLVNVNGRDDVFLPKTSVDYRMVNWAEEAHDHFETFMYFGSPDRGTSSDGPRERGNGYYVGDKFFVGGLQVDRWGNVNLIGLRDDSGGWAVRGPGTVGICDIMTVRDVYVFMTQHDPRRLVDEVDYVSQPGPVRWRELGFPGGGPKHIVTPKAVFDFAEGPARLVALMPGSTVDEVRAATGFEFGVSKDLEHIAAPVDAELATLRGSIDPEGVLQI